MANNMGTFEFAEILRETQSLKDELRKALVSDAASNLSDLAHKLDDITLFGATSDAPPLTIAFIGQYNAGKSTILRVLTGRNDIVIDSDVCTDTVTAYDWNGVRFLDTPGIHAGRADHDETTYAIIDRADLLVFVITNELFDDTIGRHFRELAFTRQHAGEMLLVVNKMGQDPGTPETKRGDIEKVIAPLSAADLRTVFIDARSWLEAQDEPDEQDRRDLLEIANIGDLIAALNAFIADRGIAGRLSAPLFAMRGMAEQACSSLSVDLPEEHAALELLHRKRGLLLASRARLRTAMNGVIAQAVTDIGRLGDEVAEAVEPGKTQTDIETLHAAAQKKASLRSETLSLEAQQCVESELEDLAKQLDALQGGNLAQELRYRMLTATANGNGQSGTASWSERPSGVGQADWPATAKKISDVANNIGSWAAKWATGPAAQTANPGSIIMARGSDAHKVVYEVGKFFGVKFQPWGAVKIAHGIGVAGRVIAAAGGVLAVFAQVAEDQQNEQQRLQLRDARDGVRSAYRDCALSVQTAVWARFEAFLADFYDSELEAVDHTVEELTGKRRQRSSSAAAFDEMVRRAGELIGRVHAITRCALSHEPVVTSGAMLQEA